MVDSVERILLNRPTFDTFPHESRSMPKFYPHLFCSVLNVFGINEGGLLLGFPGTNYRTCYIGLAVYLPSKCLSKRSKGLDCSLLYLQKSEYILCFDYISVH